MVQMTSPRSKHAVRSDARPPRQVLRALGAAASASLIVAAMAAGIAALHMRAAAVPSAQPVPPLSVAAVPIAIEEGYKVTTAYIGRIEAARRTALAFERGGLVDAVMVEEGSVIAAGDIVARLDTDLLRARRDGLLAQRRDAEAQRDLALRTAGRQRSLNEMGFASAQRFDEAQLSATALEARIESVAAEIAGLDIEIEKASLRAPFGGTIARRLVDEGTVAAAGAAIVELLETGRMQARVGIAAEPGGVLDGQTGYTLHAGGRELAGRLVSVRPDLDAATRTLEAVFDVQSDRTLAEGAIVELRIERTVATAGAWLPLSALKEDASGLWTLTVVEPSGDGHRAARAAVEVLHVAGARAFVRGTFNAHALVLADGADRVVPGQQVVLAGR
jgi:RND family efflux transporter MFP subunit